MAILNLTSSSFADIALIWLFDQVMNQDQVTNEDFKKFLEKNGNKLRTPLIKYYLDTSPTNRMYYKRIKDSFDGSNKVNQIRIGPIEKIEKEVESEKDGILKKVIKKAIKATLGKGKKESMSLQDEEDAVNLIKEEISKILKEYKIEGGEI